MYTPPAGNNIQFNFTESYTPPAGNAVAFNFTEGEEPPPPPSGAVPVLFIIT